jgi:hypothetical protein
MSNTDGGSEHLKRRAWAAVYKYKQFLDTLEKVAESSFPHVDGKEALDFIREYFRLEQKELLERIASIGDLNSKLISQLLPRARELTSTYTRALGLILRSTNLRNNFEIYYSLRKLSKASVGQDTRLIVSSEWTFVPFTVPMNLTALPDFIFVGSPAAESKNLLVTPLAGHEIGHSVWKKMEGEGQIIRQITETAKRYVEENFVELGYSSIEDFEAQETDLFEQLMAKAEEVFCDMVGLYIFGTAYALSYEYYLAPGHTRMMERYPSDSLRVSAIKRFASSNEIECNEGVFLDWKEPIEFDGPLFRAYRNTDVMLGACLDILEQACITRMKERGISLPQGQVVDDIYKSFLKGEPYAKKAKLSEVVNALWRIATQKEIWHETELEELLFYNEVALKTIEVLEYHSRREDAQGNA